MKCGLQYLWPVPLLMLLTICGCGGESGSSSDSGISEVTFVDNGAVTLNPTITTVTFSANSVAYSETQSGKVIEQWSSVVSLSDFSSLQEIIRGYNLSASGDVTLVNAQSPCIGHHGASITIKEAGNAHTIKISGLVICQSDSWPEGVRKLMDLKSDLVAKYQ